MSAAIVGALADPRAVAEEPAVPPGIWLVDGKAAVEIYDCSGRMCGRIVWLTTPSDPLERQLDKNNPDPRLRERPLCGLTIIRDLRPAGANRWRGGRFYNPNDGVMYRISARLASDDVILARIYLGWPIFGEDKRLERVSHGASEGWC